MDYIDIALKQMVVGVAGAIITYLVTLLKAKQKEIEDKDKLLKDLVENDKAMFRSDIVCEYYQWKDKGYMPPVVKESLYSCFERYKECNGNGYVDGIMAEIKKLPSDEKDFRKI